MNLAAVILAAGQGTRMKSSLPKVLHPILGRPMLAYAIDATAGLASRKPVLVVGHGAEQITEMFANDVEFVLQKERLGTGHAVMQAESVLKGEAEQVLVTYGDMPLLRKETLVKLVNANPDERCPVVLLTVVMEQSHGFGRIVRNGKGEVEKIVEEAHADEAQLKINEFNAGVYVFHAPWLWENLQRIPLSPKGEYYLTDLVDLAIAAGLKVQAIRVDDEKEVIGVNNRIHLAEVVSVIRKRINEQWMLHGVTIVDPATTYIEPTVVLAKDVTVYPNTHLTGKTTVGENSVIGPNSIVADTKIGESCMVRASVLEGAVLEDHVDIGPFGHLRKGAHLASHVHMGNFGEVKDSFLGEGTKMGHFSYIGNATIGKNVNIGAGTITCNYDGEKKNPTKIGDDVFIGSDTMLVAPVELGNGAHTGAGAVVTKNIRANTLAVGLPARAIRKLPPKKDKNNDHNQ